MKEPDNHPLEPAEILLIGTGAALVVLAPFGLWKIAEMLLEFHYFLSSR